MSNPANVEPYLTPGFKEETILVRHIQPPKQATRHTTRPPVSTYPRHSIRMLLESELTQRTCLRTNMPQ